VVPADAPVVDVSEEEGAVLGLPTEADEASFLASLDDEDGPAAPPPAPVESGGNGPIPDLSVLVNRIPASVREIVDDLFRARFSSVRRVPAKALKQP
jgi:hypothetical protein